MSSPAERSLEASPWTVPRIVAFRFMFAYVVLYCFPSPLEMIPKLDWLAGKYGEGLVHLAAWLGARLLGIEVDPDAPRNGSGDRTIDYLLVFTDLLLATLATVVWSLIDRRRPHHRRLAEGLWIYVRYILALTMIAYGLAKVFKSQFPFPSPARLAQPIGNTSPMGILWTFMGYSTPYNVFTGGMECLGGLLLFSRRTTTLGALVIVGVMTNVVALNFCYDVPVKLYSTHLLLLAIGLALPDLRRLANVLVLNRPTTPRPPAPPLPRRWMQRARWIAKLAVLGWSTYFYYDDVQTTRHARTAVSAELAPFHAAFTVDSYQVGGAEAHVPGRWRNVNAGRPGYLFIERDDRTEARYGIKPDPAAGTLAFTLADAEPGTAPGAHVLSVRWTDAAHLVLEGTFEGTPIRVGLTRRDDQWRLVTRGFHWVNEFPYNR